MTKKTNRLLAAVMFTDMVGYTALMQEDETRAKNHRDRHRKILEKSIAEHEGEILQFYGDGTLSIFKSAIEAVECAIQVQAALQAEPKIPLRIGIHTGEIVYDKEGVYGDCVNVASRIEGLAVSGSIRKAGNRVRITAQLINTADGYHIWSETYDRQLDDIFAIQDEIARKITNRLKEKMSLEEKEVAYIKPPTRNIEAYDTYLKGLFHSHKWTLQDAEAAIKEYQRAIDMEPDFVLPYSGLSVLFVYLGGTGKYPVHEALPKAKEYALKALQLDDCVAESHIALANVYLFYDWEWDKALQSLEKAIDLNPNSSDALVTKALCLSMQGDFMEAKTTIHIALRLNPFYAPGHFAHASILYFAGQYHETLKQINRLFEISPHFPDAMALRGQVYLLLGDYNKAEDIFRQVLQVPGFELFADSYLGSLAALQGRPEEAREYLEKILMSEKKCPSHTAAISLATLYAALGEPDKMFQYLNQGVQTKDPAMIHFPYNPLLKKYRSYPRFGDLLRKMGIRE